MANLRCRVWSAPRSRHPSPALDWWHISMRVQHIEQALRGVYDAEPPHRRCGGIPISMCTEGAVVFAKVCEHGLEGIVSKRAGSFYKSGKSRNWLKTINPDLVRT